MAEEIVFGVVEKIVTELGYLAVQEIESAWGVSKELKDLHNTVSTIKALLLHAEEMQVNNPAVKEWLRRIKNVAYEAEDVIDEFSIENTHRKLLLQENPIKKMTVVVSYIGGQKLNSDYSKLSPTESSLLVEGIAQNSTGSVFTSEGGEVEISGSPTEKAILSFGVKLGMNFDALALATEPPTDHLMKRSPVGRRQGGQSS